MSPLDPAHARPAATPPCPPEPQPPDISASPPPGTAPPVPDAGPAAADAGRELPRLQHPVRGRRLAPKAEPGPALTPQQRLLLLDAWRRSGLPAADFAPLVGVRPADRVLDGHGVIPPKGGQPYGPWQSM
jgi:hypothetical protein